MILKEDQELPDRVAASFNGLTVFITGGTGFMGKVLIEKLLRKCPDIKSIVLLIRNKKGKNPKERLLDLFQNPLFDHLRELRGGVAPLLEKMSTVSGDAVEPDLALSAEDREYITKNTDVIIHAAATIRFDEALRKAVFLNVRGTRLILELGKQCKNLKLFFHISTAYCHLNEKLIEERAYPPPHNPHQVISAMETMDDETVESITPKMLDKLPNSYAYSKALSEGLAVEAMNEGMPIIIVRPSIVVPIYKEPLPGWTDNINGPTGLLIGAGKGVIRTMYCKSNSYADYLPVDIFINGLMIAAWNYIDYGDKENSIVNFTSSAEIKITWDEMIGIGRKIVEKKIPLNGVAWYPGGSMKHNRFHHNVCLVLYHWLPALLVDGLLMLLRYEPVLMRVQRRIAKGFDVFEYYTNNQWDFKSDIAQTVRQRLNEREKQDYKCDSNGVNIEKYFEDCTLAARRYILKEPDSTLPAAKRHMKVMWYVDKIVKIVIYGLFMYWFYKIFVNLFQGNVTASPEPIREF